MDRYEIWYNNTFWPFKPIDIQNFEYLKIQDSGRLPC